MSSRTSAGILRFLQTLTLLEPIRLEAWEDTQGVPYNLLPPLWEVAVRPRHNLKVFGPRELLQIGPLLTAVSYPTRLCLPRLHLDSRLHPHR